LKKSVLRKIFGPKRDEVTKDWRNLHNEELHNLYPSPGIIAVKKSRRKRGSRHVARMAEMRNSYRILMREKERRIETTRKTKM
jgi:hypothetical protein